MSLNPHAFPTCDAYIQFVVARTSIIESELHTIKEHLDLYLPRIDPVPTMNNQEGKKRANNINKIHVTIGHLIGDLRILQGYHDVAPCPTIPPLPPSPTGNGNENHFGGRRKHHTRKHKRNRRN